MAISLMVFHQCRIPRSVEGRFLSNCDSISDSTFSISSPDINTFLMQYKNLILNKKHISKAHTTKYSGLGFYKTYLISISNIYCVSETEMKH